MNFSIINLEANQKMKNDIIVDLDDTLCFTLNRDFENARPNVELIEKLNRLSRNGYTIHIVTARGQLSCNGNSELADKKYRLQITNWLTKHLVIYSTLSFEKKLGRYYIDDKAMTPELFLDLQFDSIGKSGCHVAMDSFFVYKDFTKYEEAQNLIEWSKFAKLFFKDFEFKNMGSVIIPEIHTLIGSEVKMDRLTTRPHVIESLKRAIQIPLHFSTKTPMFKQTPMIYIENIFSHLSLLDSSGDERAFVNLIVENISNAESLRKILLILSASKSFSHGDFSIQNVLNVASYNIGLIDPIFDESKFSSFVLDLAKLKWSLIIENNATWLNVFNQEFDNNIVLNALKIVFDKFVICEGIRTLKYCDSSEKLNRMEIIKKLCIQEMK